MRERERERERKREKEREREKHGGRKRERNAERGRKKVRDVEEESEGKQDLPNFESVLKKKKNRECYWEEMHCLFFGNFCHLTKVTSATEKTTFFVMCGYEDSRLFNNE